MLFLFLGVLVLLCLIGVAVSYAIGITSVVVVIFERGLANIPYEIFAQRMIAGLNNFLLLVIPFFLLAGKLMNVSTVTDRIFGFASTLVGFLPGGLGHANVLASVIFAGKSGSAVADASGLGTIQIKAMTKRGYDLEFTSAITAASSTIGPVIPPSIPLVMYGAVGGVSVGALFLGGILPGVIMAIALMILVHIYAIKRNYPREKFPTLKDIWVGFKDAFFALLTPIILIGGIVSGIFTPTEAGAVAATYALALMIFYRKFSFKEISRILIETLRESSAILFIVAISGIYGWLLAKTRIPVIFAEAVLSISETPIVVLLLLNVFLLILGCFMETITAIIIVTPIIMPLAMTVGIDPVHLGVVMTLNLMIGLLTPPIGMCLFTVARVANIPLDKLIKATAPFYIPLLIALLLITIFPQTVTFLPSLFF
jgi:tripartite ATP-independent transporter DctM subunit